MVQIEEKSANEEESINNENPDGIRGMREDFIVHLARIAKDTQQMEKHCYHCDNPNHFVYDCPQLARKEGRYVFKPERGDGTKERRMSPSRKDSHAEGAPWWDA